MKPFATFQSNGLPESCQVLSVRGQEALSRPYRYDVTLGMGSDVDFDMADAIGMRASFTLARDGSTSEMVFHGQLASLQLLRDSGQWSIYRAVVVPKLWQLGLNRQSRVFTEMSLPDILKEVLEDAGVTSRDYELRLTANYDPEELVCQYKESALDFLHRWLEHRGLYYFFEHREEGAKLVIADHKSAHDARADGALPYRPGSAGDVSIGECFDTFTCKHQALPEVVRVVDYDYANPSLDVSGKATIDPDGAGEVHLHADRFFSPADGAILAAIRAEELKATRVVYFGSANAFDVRCGSRVEIDKHPRASMNAEYLVTEVKTFVNQTELAPEIEKLIDVDYPEAFKVEVTAIKADVQYRHPRSTAWPRVLGYESGVVDGAAESEYAQIDDQGRYRIRFHFDQSGLRGGKASTYVRMMQPHGGATEGFHFPLRKGTEVVMSFQGGDPDRPVIAGVVPNAHTPSPVTSKNHSTNVIQTGGRNRIELEDQEGFQRITIKTPTETTMLRMGAPNDDHNAILKTDGNTLHFTGGRLDNRVSGNTVDERTGPIEEKFGSTYDTKITGQRTVEIAAGENRTISAWYNVEVGNAKLHSGGVYHQLIDGHNLRKSATMKDVSGGVTLEWGPVGLTWGATAAKLDSLNLNIPGACNIVAPSWDLTAASTHWFQSFSGGVTGAKEEATGVVVSATGVAQSITGVSASGTGVSLGVTGVKVEAAGIVASQDTFVVKKTPVNARVYGACLWVANVFSVE